MYTIFETVNDELGLLVSAVKYTSLSRQRKSTLQESNSKLNAAFSSTNVDRLSTSSKLKAIIIRSKYRSHVKSF